MIADVYGVEPHSEHAFFRVSQLIVWTSTVISSTSNLFHQNSIQTRRQQPPHHEAQVSPHLRATAAVQETKDHPKSSGISTSEIPIVN